MIKGQRIEQRERNKGQMKGFLISCPSLGYLTTNEVLLVLSRELFECLSLGLGD